MSPNSIKTNGSAPSDDTNPSSSSSNHTESDSPQLAESEHDAPDYIDGLQDALLTGMGVMVCINVNNLHSSIH